MSDKKEKEPVPERNPLAEMDARLTAKWRAEGIKVSELKPFQPGEAVVNIVPRRVPSQASPDPTPPAEN